MREKSMIGMSTPLIQVQQKKKKGKKEKEAVKANRKKEELKIGYTSDNANLSSTKFRF